jgi:integrase
MALKQSAIDALTTPGMHLIERGLYLQVRGPASRSWIFRYRFQGRQHDFGLGSAFDVSVAEARNRRDDARTALRAGIEPVKQKRDSEAQVRVDAHARVTFREHAELYLHAHDSFWSNDVHRAQWRQTLEKYVYPLLGERPPATITTSDIVDVLRPLWADKHETARRLRGRIETILDYAADPDDTNYRNPAARTAPLLRALPKVKRDVKNHPALPYAELPAFFAALNARDSMAARALELTILTAARTSETLGARWAEINHDNKLWIIPATRMKKRREHRVPLSDAAVAVLERAREAQVGAYVFPSLPADRPFSNMAMLALLRRLGRADLTVHGFRSTFRDWAGDCTTFDRETVEFALAHHIADATEAAYRRGSALVKRTALMQQWGAFCTTPPADVVELAARR